MNVRPQRLPIGLGRKPSVFSIFLRCLITEEPSSGKRTSWTQVGISGQVEGVAISEHFFFLAAVASIHDHEVAQSGCAVVHSALRNLPTWLDSHVPFLVEQIKHPPTSGNVSLKSKVCEKEQPVSLTAPPTSSVNIGPLAIGEHGMAESLIRDKPRQIQIIPGPASQAWSARDER